MKILKTANYEDVDKSFNQKFEEIMYEAGHRVGEDYSKIDSIIQDVINEGGLINLMKNYIGKISSEISSDKGSWEAERGNDSMRQTMDNSVF